MNPQLIKAGVFAAILVLALFGIFTLMAVPSGSDRDQSRLKFTPVVEAEFDCQLIEEEVKSLRKVRSGGFCETSSDCRIVGQACSSIPADKAQEMEDKFSSLLDMADQLSCNTGFLICEFVAPSCRNGQCALARSVNQPPIRSEM
uniref:hypothetical protein n=1 Tax=Microbulbifer agarilyticus TaxID=260552 RepID=UPI001110A7D3|nr:hypothetical protein [Microbulbifer agarilyticus]